MQEYSGKTHPYPEPLEPHQEDIHAFIEKQRIAKDAHQPFMIDQPGDIIVSSKGQGGRSP
ncbi:hypothetical protein D3C84_1269300 [compost metagenome]